MRKRSWSCFLSYFLGYINVNRTDKRQQKSNKKDIEYQNSEHQGVYKPHSGRMERRRYQSQGHLFQPPFNSQHHQHPQQPYFNDVPTMNPGYNNYSRQEQQREAEVNYNSNTI